MARRRTSEPGSYATAAVGEPVPPPVLRWQSEAHGDWAYDLVVDTSAQSPEECTAAIAERLDATEPAEAFARLAI